MAGKLTVNSQLMEKYVTLAAVPWKFAHYHDL